MARPIAFADRRSAMRTAHAVRRVEHMTRTGVVPRGGDRIGAAAPTVAFARADIEHDDFGTVAFGTGSDFDATVTEDATREVQAYNPRLKVWDGARLLIFHCALPSGDGNKYNIFDAFSATKIRATAPAGGIAAGASATVNKTSVVALDGTYAPATDPTVYLNTSNVAVGGSETIWCLLTWHVGSGTSRWEVFASDCV